ncbi:hypothetical protein [Halobaculum lipolyticum]|nr:hypothetical protein [Halobaculum sp. DT31]
MDEDPHAELRDDEDDVVTDGGVWGRNESGYLSAETCPKCGEELQYQGHHGQLQCLSTPSHTFTHLRTGSGTHWLADADGETHAKTTIADEPAPHSGGWFAVSRSGPDLGDFGIVPPTVVRHPPTSRASMHLCAECGVPIEGTKGSHVVQRPNLVSDEVADAVGDRLVVFGFVCERHRQPVVHPHPTNRYAANVNGGRGWTGVRLEFSDTVVRWVATPESQVER